MPRDNILPPRLLAHAALALIACGLALCAQSARAQEAVIARFADTDSSESDPLPRVYSISLGGYPTLKQAIYLRDIVQHLGPARVDKAGEVYRVILGSFPSEALAETFVRENSLSKLFTHLTVDIVSGSTKGVKTPEPKTNEAEPTEKDHRTLAIDLYCGDKPGGPPGSTDTATTGARRRGKYVASFTPEPGQSPVPSSIEVKWSCVPGDPSDTAAPISWTDKDRERNPSYFGVSAVSAMGSLSADTGTLSGASWSHFSYGLRLSAFKSFGGIGPLGELRLGNVRYSSGSANGPGLSFNFQQSALLGFRLPFAHRLEVEPLYGFTNQPFLSGAALADTTLVNAWMPQLGGRLRFRALELSERGSIDLTLGYSRLLATTTSTVGTASGSTIVAQMRARHFTPSGWGADWFFEFESTSRITSGDSSQSESLFRVGVTVMFETK